MRMRKLGKGQSVMFCGSMEIQQKILEYSGKSRFDALDVADVLFWCISETCMNTRRCVPLWATQGMRYQRRHLAWSDPPADGGLSLDKAMSVLEPEAQSLEERYGWQDLETGQDRLFNVNAKSGLHASRAEQIERIQSVCQEFNVTTFLNAALQEEQERELSPENERERQIERLPSLEPATHSIHKDVKHFIQNGGALKRTSLAFLPAFDIFRSTSALEHMERSAWPDDLLVTNDCAQTVQAAANQAQDDFLRPQKNGDCIVLSPYEAHKLLPLLRQNKSLTLHTYAPRLIGRSAGTFQPEILTYCSIPAVRTFNIPPALTMQLNLFAGQLYFADHATYVAVCRFLGLASAAMSADVLVGADGFVDADARAALDETWAARAVCPFGVSPVGFLKALLVMRRKGHSFRISQLGRVLEGEMLGKNAFP
ncbi:MAG: hypothetical protein M1829_001367 [Trizodia sp. TS-e1964]|nr:MAG: hypothetical protein M1829_001367 [Trizodia sp. TS-e1964]